MAETGGFLARWSRLKRREDEQLPSAAALPDGAAPAAAPEAGRPDRDAEGEEGFDASSLPPIESLCADSDYTAFLRQGVPEQLQTLALRKAWATDPAIAGFRGLAEYDWDCNAPGYAALWPTDDVARLCEAVLGPAAAPEAEAEEPPPVATAAAEADAGEEGTDGPAGPEPAPSAERAV